MDDVTGFWDKGSLSEVFRTADIVALKGILELGHQSDALSGVIPTSAAAPRKTADGTAEKRERRRRQRADDEFISELFRLGDLDTYVAENIVMGMIDSEIAETVSAIEEETGQDFESYARDILGPKMPDRREGESDTDFNRRVLILLADEMLNDDLTIRPEFADDPLAKIITESEVFQEALDVVAERSPDVKDDISVKRAAVAVEGFGAFSATPKL